MAKIKNPYILIPVFLNVILLMGLPFFGGGADEVGRLVPLLLLALVFPWVLAFGIGRIVEHVLDEQRRRREDRSDFV